MIASLTAAVLIIIGPLIGVLAARSRSNVPGESESSLRFGAAVTGLSASASGNSAFILVGAVGLGCTIGVSALWIPFGFWIGDIIFWYLVAPRLVRRVQETGVETISELIAHQSTNHALLALRVGALVVIVAVGLFCIAQFLAVGKVVVELFRLDTTTAFAGVIAAGLFSVLMGGLGSSMLVNVYQSILMVCSAILLISFACIGVFEERKVLLQFDGASELLNPFYLASGFQLALFVVTFIIQGLLFATCNPHVLARITKGDAGEIPKIRWVYMGFMQSLWWLMTGVGVFLALLGLQVSDPDSAGIAFAGAVMQPVALGFVIAGIAAASMSTGEAQLLVIANALTMDLAPDAFRRLGSRRRQMVLIIGRILVAGGLFFSLLTLNLELVAQLVIQAASLVLSAFAVPAVLFIFRIVIDGRVMAAIILCGATATFLNRMFVPSLMSGHEIYTGLVAATLVAILGLRFFRQA